MDFADEDIESMISSLSIYSSGRQRDTRVQEIVDIRNERSRLLERVEGLTTKLHADCKANREKLSQLEKERSHMRKELTKLRDDDVSVTKKLEKMKAQLQDTKFKVNQKSQKSSILESEMAIKHKAETELNAYRDLTGIRWNFDVSENVISGIITNSQNKFVKPIELQKTAPSKKIRETLWSYIKESGSADWDKLEDEENQQ